MQEFCGNHFGFRPPLHAHALPLTRPALQAAVSLDAPLHALVRAFWRTATDANPNACRQPPRAVYLGTLDTRTYSAYMYR